MSKASLILDMPKTCLDCMFCFELDEGINACCSFESFNKFSLIYLLAIIIPS